ncbi:MAG: alpha-amylase family glycosyl hydrolase [bacterium]
MKSLVRRNLVCLALVACSATALAQGSAATSAAPAHTPAAWTRHSVIYEVNVRQFTPEGTFAAARLHLARLHDLGIDLLWVMPIQPIGTVGRKGLLGSPYSVSDYRAVNPEYGTAADFNAFVQEAHKRGIKVILDWVPNHTAFDHKWITQHPDWYVHRKDGSISYALDGEHKETDWTDVAALNYDNKDMRKAMLAEMTYWLDTAHIDGFRCDVAGGPPNDFWADARNVLEKVRPGLFMLAEAEGPQFYPSFDMTYGWEFHHLLNELAQQKQPTSALDTYFAKEDQTYPRDAYRMYFTSNHDENSWNGSEFERMGDNHLAAYILSATIWSGMPLLYTGQEVSMKKRLRFFEKDTVDWTGPSLASFYKRVLQLKHSQGALSNGAWGGRQAALRTNGGERTYAFSRSQGKNTVLVAVNFGDAPVRAAYSGFMKPGAYRDWFANSSTILGASGEIDIPAHGYRVLVQ